MKVSWVLERSRAETLAAGEHTVAVATAAGLKQTAMHGAHAVVDSICNPLRGEPTQYPRRTLSVSSCTARVSVELVRE